MRKTKIALALALALSALLSGACTAVTTTITRTNTQTTTQTSTETTTQMETNTLTVTTTTPTVSTSTATTTETTTITVTTSITPASTGENGSFSIKLATKPGLGTYLVDGAGRTLYWTTRDAPGQSNVTGSLLAQWPVFYNAVVVVPDGLDAANFAIMVRPADGALQLTYKGWPLYYYSGDTAMGDTNGQNLESSWFIINPNASAPAFAPPTTGG